MAEAETVLAEEPQEIPAEPVEAEEVETEAAEEPVEAAETAEEAEPDAEEPTEDEEPTAWEFNFAGNKMSVDRAQMPENVAFEVQEYLTGCNADYTRKSTANAELRQSLESREADIQAIQDMQADVMDLYAVARQAQTGLAQLSQIDMQQLWQSDPDQARQLSDQARQYQQQYDNASVAINEAEQKYRAKASEAEQTKEREGRNIMDRRIKDFSTKIAPKLVDHVVEEYGMDRDAAEKWGLNPLFTELAYKAMLYDQAQAKLKKPPKSEPPKPMDRPKGGSRATAGPDPSKMSTEQWMKWRNADLAKRNVRIG